AAPFSAYLGLQPFVKTRNHGQSCESDLAHRLFLRYNPTDPQVKISFRLLQKQKHVIMIVKAKAIPERSACSNGISVFLE
ncbi:MAG: hypothetical protein KDE54_15465, partial [Caldilineaceae bacterium]|nr:hypothetical protein [Caldilineaceae bacterium]